MTRQDYSTLVRETGFSPAPWIQAAEDGVEACCDWVTYTLPKITDKWQELCDHSWYDEIVMCIGLCLTALKYPSFFFSSFSFINCAWAGLCIELGKKFCGFGVYCIQRRTHKARGDE